MARPPKNQKGPSASERMINAFWYILEQKPFTKITVSDIVKEAQVNRNAFYYHYENINDLANKAVQGLIAEDGPYIVTEMVKTNGAYLDEILGNLKRTELLKRIRLIASWHSSPDLTNMLKDAIITTWLKSFDVDRTKLNDEARVILTFAAGGLVEILGKWQAGAKGIRPQTLISSGMATDIAKLVAHALSPIANEKSRVEELLLSNELPNN